MPTTLTYSPGPHAPATARTQLVPTRRYARYAETHPVPPLKGLRETRASSVSYRASVPAGQGGRGATLSYRASSPDGESLPFGIEENPSVTSAPTANYSLLTANWTYTFSAKERDPETGYSYFGSRYYSSDLSIWLSVDPMSDKYASLSPYVYCANNPVKLVDPNGEEVWIIGDDVVGALRQLQNQTGLKLSISDDGKLSYTGKPETEIDNLIAEAINDDNITVNMIANISNTFGDVTTEVGGGYMGNTYEDGHVCTDQFVSTSLLADFDNSVGDAKTGLTMVHELAESYYGGQIALQREESSPISGVGCTYNEAHLKANKIAIGNRGPIDFPVNLPGSSFRFNKPGDAIHRMRDGVLDYNHIYIRIGWVRQTDKNGM